MFPSHPSLCLLHLGFYWFLFRTFFPLGCKFLQVGFLFPGLLCIPQPEKSRLCLLGTSLPISSFPAGPASQSLNYSSASGLLMETALLFHQNSRGKYDIQSPISYYKQNMASWKDRRICLPMDRYRAVTVRCCGEADRGFLLGTVDVGLFGLTLERQRDLTSIIFNARHKVAGISGLF